MSQFYTGTIVGLKTKSATVLVFTNEIHPKYYKPIKKRKKFQAHNEEYSLQLGDKVVIKSSRPYSATKRFLVIKKEESK